MFENLLKIGSIFSIFAIPVFLLAAPDVSELNKDLMDINVGNYNGRTLPEDLMFMFSNATDEPDDLQDCMQDFSKCIGVHIEMPFCGTTAEGAKKNFTSICHLAYENCKVGTTKWQSTDDNKKYCDKIDQNHINKSTK